MIFSFVFGAYWFDIFTDLDFHFPGSPTSNRRDESSDLDGRLPVRFLLTRTTKILGGLSSGYHPFLIIGNELSVSGEPFESVLYQFRPNRRPSQQPSR
jgi:hypothetical protein